MAALTVARSIAQSYAETVQKRQFLGENDILLNPDYSPLLSMTTKAGNRRGTIAARTEWVEDDFVSFWGQASEAADVSSVGTNIAVADVTLFVIGDLVCQPNADSSATAEEVMRVTAIAGTSTGTITVTRGVGSTTAQTIGSTADLRIIGNAYAEGASVGTIRSTAKVVKISYTQIMRQPFSITNSQRAQQLFGGSDEYAKERDKSLAALKRDIEQLALFGAASESTALPGTIRTSMGFKSRVTTNAVSGSTTLTESGMLSFLEQLFDDYWGSDANERTFLCAPKIISALDFFSGSNLLYGPQETVLGVKVRRYISNHGDLLVVRDLLLQDGPLGGLGAGDEAYAVHIPSIEYRFLNGNGVSRDTHLIENVQTPGDDLIKSEWLNEGCWNIRHEKRHGRLYAVTAYA